MFKHSLKAETVPRPVRKATVTPARRLLLKISEKRKPVCSLSHFASILQLKYYSQKVSTTEWKCYTWSACVCMCAVLHFVALDCVCVCVCVHMCTWCVCVWMCICMCVCVQAGVCALRFAYLQVSITWNLCTVLVAHITFYCTFKICPCCVLIKSTNKFQLYYFSNRYTSVLLSLTERNRTICLWCSYLTMATHRCMLLKCA